MANDYEVNHGRRWHSRRRDFWRAWDKEQEEMQQAADSGDPASPAAYDWRDYFHDYMGTWPEQHWAFSGRRFTPWHQGVAAFNPFVAGLLSKGGGLLPIYVLHLLSQSPRYANEIMDAIIERTGGQWAANPGAIYPLMAMLENNGLIEGEWGDPRKRTVRVYQLTREGYRELRRLKSIIRPKLREAVTVLSGLAEDLSSDLDITAPTEEVDTVYLNRGF